MASGKPITYYATEAEVKWLKNNQVTTDEIIGAIVIMAKGSVDGKRAVRELLKQIKEIKKYRAN